MTEEEFALTKRSCTTCSRWKRFDSEPGCNTLEEWGECRALPPAMVYDPGENAVIATYPAVGLDDYCGLYHPVTH
jgi:hypothetical protein